MLVMDERGEHQDLRGLGRRNVISYVHGRMGVVLLCVRCSSYELNLLELGLRATTLVLASARAFYNSRPDSYNETQGPTGGPGASKTLCGRALMTKSSE
jgi:hypothetical protein